MGNMRGKGFDRHTVLTGRGEVKERDSQRASLEESKRPHLQVGNVLGQPSV
jgi:hypothetical protein